MFARYRYPALIILTLFPAVAAAQVVIDTTVHTSIPQILNGLVNVMLFWAAPIATVLFLIGAFWLTASGGNENAKDKGKKIMQGAAIGLAIILGSWMIISTVVYYLAA